MKAKIKGSFWKRNRGFIYILPWLIGFLVFKLYPFTRSIYYSFQTYNMMSAPKFVGFKNYIDIFTADKFFGTSFWITVKYVLMVVPTKLLIALLVALMLSRSTRVSYALRSIYYLPSILGGSVAVAMIWKVVFSESGVLNNILSVVGVKGPAWFSPQLALFTLGLLNIWQFGSTMVLFLAAIKAVPQDLYDAATVDGAGKMRTFFNITLPMISSIFFFNLLMGLVNTFQEFTGTLLITQGGPLKSTYLYGYMLYENAFLNYKMGYACAESWVLFAVIMVLTVFIFRTQKYWTYYEDGGDSV
jgi:oligogalacturonide transport system permease protein